MVVGAYTIINTLGLLCGLPFTTSKAPSEVAIDINHNFSEYILNYYFDNNVFNETLFKQNSCVLINTNDSHYYSNGFSIATENIFPYENDFINHTMYYNYHSKIDSYLVFTCNEILSENDSKQFFTELTVQDNQDEIYTFNQIYLGVLTSSLSSINGDSVIGSITSGLGLMGDITTNFKNGFSALIWNSTDSKLTTFGNFALIFLGVSITFAIVKLCLNLIRSKTGA